MYTSKKHLLCWCKHYTVIGATSVSSLKRNKILEAIYIYIFFYFFLLRHYITNCCLLGFFYFIWWWCPAFVLKRFEMQCVKIYDCSTHGCIALLRVQSSDWYIILHLLNPRTTFYVLHLWRGIKYKILDLQFDIATIMCVCDSSSVGFLDTEFHSLIPSFILWYRVSFLDTEFHSLIPSFIPW